MLRFASLLFAFAASGTAAAPAPADPRSVFVAYDAAVEAGDRAAVEALIGDHPAPTPFAFCSPNQGNRECLIDYLAHTVVTTHSIITPIAVTVRDDQVEAKIEVRNDLTRAAGVERLAGTDRIKVTGGKIVAFAFIRDQADPQTQAFFRFMMSTMPPGARPQLPNGEPSSEPPPR